MAAEAAAERANAELRANDQLKTDLIGMLSHEVGQPLTSIRGYAEVLQEDWQNVSPAQRELAVSRIDSGARRLTQIVDEILSVRVCDCGEGVPDSFVGHLFERYTRAETGVTKRAAGTGLGLFIVARLAEANRGTVAYQANQPTGACLVIRLPRHVG